MDDHEVVRHGGNVFPGDNADILLPAIQDTAPRLRHIVFHS